MRTGPGLPSVPMAHSRPVFHRELGEYFASLRKGRKQATTAGLAERKGLTHLTRQVLLRLESGQTKFPRQEVLRELAKMKPEHVKLQADAGECHVPTGKGGKRYRFVPLNAKGVAAWQAFAAAKAWGPYDKNLLRRSFQRACRAEAKTRQLPLERVRVYDLRHSVATAYLKAGADLADVQDLLGHTTTRMTRRYAPQQRQKLVAAAKSLE